MDYFEAMPAASLIGIGPELTPHYSKMLGSLMAPSYQGFNSGVVLFQFEKMRKSNLYNAYITPDEVGSLMKKYSYRMSLAEQDWFTNLGISHPN